MIALLDALGRTIDMAPSLTAARETAATYRTNGHPVYVDGEQPARPVIAYTWIARADIAEYDDLASITAPPLTTRRAA